MILTTFSIDGRWMLLLVLRHWLNRFNLRMSLAVAPVPVAAAPGQTGSGPGRRQAAVSLGKTVLFMSSAEAGCDRGANKAAIRKLYSERRRSLAAAARDRASEEICGRLVALPEVLSAPILALYLAFDNEVNIDKLIAEFGPREKRVLVPRFNRSSGDYEMVEIENIDSDTATGHYGIREPRAACSALARSELSDSHITWLIPGVAFDLAGHRLGRGAGFYDRLLSGLSGCRIGIAYDWQLAVEIPVEEHDQAMELVLTEQRVIRLPKCVVKQ